MFENYIASAADLETVEKGIRGWVSGFALEKLISIDKLMLCFAEGLSKPWLISGSMVTPFIASQKLKAKYFKMLNPYSTYESYLATIVHEFGHKYFDKHSTWRFSDKRKNLSYLRSAQNLYAGKKTKNSYQTIGIPSYDKRQMLLTEIFAFCADYSAASIFWKKHKKDIDLANSEEVKRLLKEEGDKDLSRKDSVLDPDPYAHSAAMVIGKIIIESNPKTWPERIINSSNFRI